MHQNIYEKEIKNISSYNLPNWIITELIKYRKNHLIKFAEEHWDYIQVFEVWFQLIVESIEVINYIKKDSRKFYNTNQYLLLKENLETLYSIFHNISIWLYQASFNSSRTYFETIIRLMYASYYKEKHSWMIHKDWVPWSPSFKISNFIKNDLKCFDLNDKYDLLSKFSHSNMFDFIKSYSENCEFHTFKMEYSNNKILLNMNFTFFYLLFTVDFIKLVFFREDFVQDYIKTQINDYWFFDKLNKYRLSLYNILNSVDKEKTNYAILTDSLILIINNLELNNQLWKQ